MSITLKSLIEKYKVKPDPSGSAKCKTPVFRSTYAFVHEPRETPNGDLKYQICMIFPKEKAGELKPLVQAIANAAAKKFGNDYMKWPRNLKCPVRDGDEERDGKEYEKSLFLNAGNKNKPGIVDRQMNEITEEDDKFYSGVYARASLNFYGYDTSGNKGVGTGLNNLLLWEDGPRLDGQSAADDDFAEFKEEAKVNEDHDDDNF